MPWRVGFSTWEVREGISEEDGGILRPSLQRLDGFICWLPCTLPVAPNAGPPFGDPLLTGIAQLLCWTLGPIACAICPWPLIQSVSGRSGVTVPPHLAFVQGPASVLAHAIDP